MIDPPPPPSGPPTPGRLFKQAVVVYAFINVVGISFLAICDAQHDDYHFRIFALALLWASVSLVASTYISMRRAWQGFPPSDGKDSVLPAVAVFALGWAIWTAVHALP